MTRKIGTVTDVPGQGARTPAEYRAIQAKRVLQRKTRVPGFSALEVYENAEPVDAYITIGVWRVRCVCGEAPSTHPAWRLACCAGCGAVYTNVIVPSDADRAAIEAVLLKRPRVRDRNWIAGWSAHDLSEQNVAHGDPT